MKFLIKLALVAIVAMGVWMLVPYFSSLEAQARKQHERLFSFASGRNWKEAKTLLASDYADAWGNNAEQAIEIAGEVLQGFIVLDLQMEPTEITTEAERVKISCNVRISGSGAGFSQQVMTEVNRLEKPWTFTWRKDGSKPSDWRLIKVEHPELNDIAPPNF